MANIRVLAFGDSLTEGYHSFGLRFHPYAKRLKQLLSEYADQVGQQKITQTGVAQYGNSGESSFDMPERLKKVFASEGTFSHVVILGGTNDLFYGDAEGIVNNLKTMFEFVRAQGAFPIAVTVPQMAIEQREVSMLKTRNLVNQALHDYAQANIGKVALVDLAARLPLYSASKHDKEEYWEGDGIHMKPAGYDRFAELVFEVLKPLLG